MASSEAPDSSMSMEVSSEADASVVEKRRKLLLVAGWVALVAIRVATAGAMAETTRRRAVNVEREKADAVVAMAVT